MSTIRLLPAALLLVSACYSKGRPSLRPGSDMALPQRSVISVLMNSAPTCGAVGTAVDTAGVTVSVAERNRCTPASLDSAQRVGTPTTPRKP